MALRLEVPWVCVPLLVSTQGQLCTTNLAGVPAQGGQRGVFSRVPLRRDGHTRGPHLDNGHGPPTPARSLPVLGCAHAEDTFVLETTRSRTIPQFPESLPHVILLFRTSGFIEAPREHSTLPTTQHTLASRSISFLKVGRVALKCTRKALSDDG